jgi:hypothetical protein
MTEKFSKTLGDLGLPANFPHLEFDFVNTKMARFSQDPTSNWFMFAAAWNGVGYRLRAAHKSSLTFDVLLDTTPVSIELRFQQDHEMFVFFASALSALECAFFAAYACVAQAAPADYPIILDKDLRITPERISEKLNKKFAGTKIVNSMMSILADPKYDELSDFRNYLAHRGTLPRRQYASVGSSAVDPPSEVSGNPIQLASSWIYDFKILPGCLNPFVVFVDIAVGNIVRGLEEFATTNLT